MSNISITNTDPGEGSPLSADNYIAVYGGKSLLDLFYPVGCYFETSDATFDPNIAWGGVWAEDTWGRVTVAYQSDQEKFNSVGKIGGEINHTLTIDEIPSHSHPQYVTANDGNQAIRRDFGSDANCNTYPQGCNTGSTGGGQTHNNLQPYIVVKRWHRTA